MAVQYARCYTYKTMTYELALFFLCLQTNVGYLIVAEFIVHEETAELCMRKQLKTLQVEALDVIKQ